MDTKEAISRLSRCIKASYPIVAIISHEETRVLEFIQALAGRSNRQSLAWSITTGLQPAWPGAAEKAIEDTADPVAALAQIAAYDETHPEAPATLFVLKDLHVYLRDGQGERPDPVIMRYLRDIAVQFETCNHTLILLSPVFQVPGDLEKSVVVIDWPLPDANELAAILEMAERDVPGHIKVHLNGDRQAIISAMQGLTAFEARSALAGAIIAAGELSDACIPAIIGEKKQIVRKSGLLEFIESDVNMAQVGGLPYLKKYSQVKLATFSEEARAFGVEPARGVLLLGLPGVGKSLSAKAITGGRMPLLRADIGALMGQYVGQSEANARTFFKIAEAVAPCCVWLDEIEKSLGGGGGEHDGGTSTRVLGAILTWMQETKSEIYFIATANDVRALRPELINRFDDTFFVDLPNRADREEIISIHLRKRGRHPQDYDLAAVADATWNMVGREIERVVKAGLEAAFYAGEPLNTQHLLDAAGQVVPISTTMDAQIKDLRAWADTRARRANEPVEPSRPAPQVANASKARFADL